MTLLKDARLKRIGAGKPEGEASVLRLIQHTIIVTAIYGAEAAQFVNNTIDPNDRYRKPT